MTPEQPLPPSPAITPLPCPWCGSAEIELQLAEGMEDDTGAQYGLVWYECANCEAQAPGPGIQDDEDGPARALEQWNQRAAPSPAPGASPELVALRKIAEYAQLLLDENPDLSTPEQYLRAPLRELKAIPASPAPEPVAFVVLDSNDTYFGSFETRPEAEKEAREYAMCAQWQAHKPFRVEPAYAGAPSGSGGAWRAEWPLANEEERKGGWAYSHAFLTECRDFAEKDCGFFCDLEVVDALLRKLASSGARGAGA